MADIQAVGEKIGRAIQAIIELVRDEGITEEELSAFMQYLGEQQALGPLLDPTAYRELQNIDGIDEAKKRVAFLRSALALRNYRPRQYRLDGTRV